jgi:hypothetical protein
MVRHEVEYRLRQGNVGGAIDSLVGDDLFMPSKVYACGKGPDREEKPRRTRNADINRGIRERYAEPAELDF